MALTRLCQPGLPLQRQALWDHRLKGLFMSQNSPTAEDRLAELRVHLPDAPSPFGAYAPAVQTGNLLFLSGMLATSGHTAKITGIVGRDLDASAGREAAHTAAL